MVFWSFRFTENAEFEQEIILLQKRDDPDMRFTDDFLHATRLTEYIAFSVGLCYKQTLFLTKINLNQYASSKLTR